MEIKRTRVAEEAASCSDLFAVSVGQLRVGGTCEFTPVLKAPEGVSTAGGQLARQHITLNPAASSETSITVGWVDVARKQSLLRNFERLEQIHRERVPGTAFPVDAKSYETFFEQAHKFLSRTGLSPVVEAPGASLTEPRTPPTTGGTSRPAALAMLAVLVVGLLIVLLLAVL